MDTDYLIFATNRDMSLATVIASDTNVPLGHMDVKKINDSETLVDIKAMFSKRDTFVVYYCTTSQ